MEPTSVYLYFDARGVLIYVGITGKGAHRQTQHVRKSEWWPFVARQDVEHYVTRGEAAMRERFLIRDYRPPFNQQHNSGWQELRAAYLTLFKPAPVPEMNVEAAESRPAVRCGHCEGCRLSLRAEYAEDELPCRHAEAARDDSAMTCDVCGSATCLYADGSYVGGMDGWIAGYERGIEVGRAQVEARLTDLTRSNQALSDVIDGRNHTPYGWGGWVYWPDAEDALATMEREVRELGVEAVMAKARVPF